MKKLLALGICGALAMTAQAAVRTVSFDAIRGQSATVKIGPAVGGETNALVMAWGDAEGGATAEQWANHRFAALVLPGENEKTVPLPEGWGEPGATKLRFFLSDGCAPDEYVTDGLMNRWDAIDNAGTGTHEAGAEVWKDLAGSIDLTLIGKGSWNVAGNALMVDGASATGAVPAQVYQSIEILCDGSAPLRNGQIVFSPGIGEKEDTQTTRIVVNHVGKLQLNAGRCITTAFPTDGSVCAFTGLYDYDVASRIFSHGLEERQPYYYNETWQRGAGHVIVGNRSTSNTQYPWAGRIYTIRLYDRKLTAAEIASNHLRDMVRFFGFPQQATATEATETVTFAKAVTLAGTIYDGAGSPSAVRVDFAGVTEPSELVMAWDATDKGGDLAAWANKKTLMIVHPSTGTRVFAVPSGWGGAVKSLRFFLRDGFAVPSQYVQSGLINWWDGINNTGNGHDPSATIWKDLAGANDLMLTNSAAWNADGNGLLVSGAGAYSDQPCAAYRTIEAVYTPTILNGVVLFNSGNGKRDGAGNINIPRAVIFDNLGSVAYLDGSQETRYALAPARSDETASLAGTCQADGTVNFLCANGEMTNLGYHKNYWGSWEAKTVIGNRKAANDYPWFGHVHTIRLYNRELTQAELFDNYRCDLVRYMGAKPKASPAIAAVSAACDYAGTRSVPETEQTVALGTSDLFRIDVRTGVREVIHRTEFLPFTWSAQNVGPEADYVREGLVSQWDGIDNAGTGVHDPAAKVWKDKVGALDMTLLSGGSWNALGNALVCNGAAAQGPAAASAYRTIETVYKMTQGGGRILFASGSSYRFVLFDGTGTIEYFDGVNAGLSIPRTLNVNQMRTSTGVYNASNAVIRVYHEGERELSGGTRKNAWNAGDGKVMVGSRSKDNAYPWYGEIYAIRLYDRELTDEEIAHNYLIDWIRFSGNPVMALLPEDMTARVTLVRLEGEGDDIAKWSPVAGSEQVLVRDEKGGGEIGWFPERGAWRLTLEVLHSGKVISSTSSLFDLRKLKPLGLRFIIR